MKTIIILSDWFLPAYKGGGPIQSIANMVEQFNEKITYKIFCSNIDLDGTILNVPVNKSVKYNESTQVLYTPIRKLSVELLKKEIKNSGSDILFITGIYSWHFNIAPLLFYKASRKIVSVRGMLHPGALSQKPLKKKLYLNLWKLLGLNKRCDFHATNEEEKKYIENTFGKKSKIFIASNFPRILARQQPPDKKMGSLQLVSIGLITPMKNYLTILESLQTCNDRIGYIIYGPIKDYAYWNICLEQIKKLPSNISIKYMGDIPPDKIEKVLENFHVFILPSKSENFGHAIYEALTAGKPVITSNNTPWNNLASAKAGINVSIENTNELTNAIKYFAAMDYDEFKQWNIGANQYAADSINIDEIKQQYKEMFFA